MKEQKYNAFISYRRTQRDVAVAKEIQKSLERFRVPKGIRSASGNFVGPVFVLTLPLPQR